MKKRFNGYPRLMRQGFTLVETLLVLAFAGILIIGAVGLYAISRAGTQASQMANDIEIVSQVLERYFMGYGKPADGSLNQVLIDSGKLPSTVKNTSGTDLGNVYGGTVSTVFNNGTYTITVTQVPKSACISIMTALPAKWDSVSIGGGEAVNTVPMTVSAANGACPDGDTSIALSREFF